MANFVLKLIFKDFLVGRGSGDRVRSDPVGKADTAGLQERVGKRFFQANVGHRQSRDATATDVTIGTATVRTASRASALHTVHAVHAVHSVEIEAVDGAETAYAAEAVDAVTSAAKTAHAQTRRHRGRRRSTGRAEFEMGESRRGERCRSAAQVEAHSVVGVDAWRKGAVTGAGVAGIGVIVDSHVHVVISGATTSVSGLDGIIQSEGIKSTHDSILVFRVKEHLARCWCGSRAVS